MLNQILIYKTSTAKIVKKIKIKTTLMAMDILKFDNKEWLVAGLGNGAIELYEFKDQVLLGLGKQNDADDEEKKKKKIKYGILSQKN